MRRNNLLKGLVSIVGGTALNLAGCRTEIKPVNHAPEISVSEVDGTPVNATKNDEIISNDNCNEIYFLAIPRGNLENNELDLMVTISDPEKRLATFNAYSIQETGNNNPMQVRYTETSSSINEAGEKYEINANVEVIANGENTSLGAHHAFNISYSDDRNDRVACFYDLPVPGTTTPPGEIPQTDDNPQPQMTLEDWACANLPRAHDNPATKLIDEGSDLKLFLVKSNGNQYSSMENAELSADQYPDIHHKSNGGIIGYRIITAGTSLGNISRMYSNDIKILREKKEWVK